MFVCDTYFLNNYLFVTAIFYQKKKFRGPIYKLPKNKQ